MEQLNTLDPEWHVILNINANENTLLQNWIVIAQKLKSAGFHYETHHVTAIGEGMGTVERLCRAGVHLPI